MNEITEEEMATPRTVPELVSWVECRYKFFGSTEVGKHAIRLRKREGFAKKLVEEALPIAKFTSFHFNDSADVTIKLNPGNESFDATVKDNREHKSLFFYIEVTQAHEGADYNSRMVVLNKEGRVNAFGNVATTGTKNKSKFISIEEEAVRHKELLKKEIRLVKERIVKKLDSDMKYDPRTALVVVFGDFLLFPSPQDWKEIKQSIRPLLPKLAEKFNWFALLHWQEDEKSKALWEVNLSDKIGRQQGVMK